VIRIAITAAAYAICSTMPEDAPLMARTIIGPMIEPSVVDRLRAVRRPGESYSDVILRLWNWMRGKRS
jgi:hypothetical protein